jgi:hypothetical protein
MLLLSENSDFRHLLIRPIYESLTLICNKYEYARQQATTNGHEALEFPTSAQNQLYIK